MIGTLAKEIPPGYCTNKDEFVKLLPKDATFKPYGELLHSYKVDTGLLIKYGRTGLERFGLTQNRLCWVFIF